MRVVFEVGTVVDAPGVVAHIGVAVLTGTLMQLGQGQLLIGIAVVELGWRGQGKVGCHERHEQHPGLVLVFMRLFAQPDLCARGNGPVVGGVGGLSRPCGSGELFCMAARGQGVAQQADQVTLLVHHVHGQDFFGEAVVFVGTAEMQFADGRHVVPAFAQQMVPALGRTVIRIGVVPKADLVNVFANGECSTCRHADGAGGVGLGKARSASGQRVEVRGLNNRVAITTQDLAAVLVGHDDKQVLRFHQRVSSVRCRTHRCQSRQPTIRGTVFF